jgi:hypothetical protein
MRDMSRAIRHELTEYGPTLQTIPDKELSDLTEILGAFFYDLVGEQDRRGGGSPRPAASVARELKLLRHRLAAHHFGFSSDCRVCTEADESLDAL